MFAKSFGFRSITSTLKKSFGNFFVIAKGLFTWGNKVSGTAVAISNESNLDLFARTIKRVERIPEGITSISMGKTHSALVTRNGELYVSGNNSSGQLGIGSGDVFEGFQQVEFFRNENIKVLEVACGKDHTLALTDDGSVWSWGSAASSLSALFKLSVNSLGINTKSNITLPQKVEEIEGKVKMIASGAHHAFAVTQSGDVWCWGDAANGQLGYTPERLPIIPILNETFQSLKKHGVTVVKIKCAGNSTIALMSDGNLYGMGNNKEGQLGIRENVGITLDELTITPTKVVNEFYKGKKVKDFALGENSLLILTEDGDVYYSGLGLAFKPVKWKLPKKVKLVTGGKNVMLAVSVDNDLYSNMDQPVPGRWDNNYFLQVAERTAYDNKAIESIGGAYGIFFALTK